MVLIDLKRSINVAHSDKAAHLETLCWRFLGVLREIAHAMDTRSRELERSYRVTLPQLNVLWAVGDGDAVPIGRIAERLSLSGATVSTIVDRLEERGLVVRQRSEADKRQVLISLGGAGSELLREVGHPFKSGFVDRLEELGEWQQTELLSAVQHVSSMLQAPEQE
jgi:DNA-binding MarR family transcriptional regulator